LARLDGEQGIDPNIIATLKRAAEAYDTNIEDIKTK
jgi:hypothetical protein